MRGSAAEWVLSQPWAITEQALGVILAIADRRNDPPEAVGAKLGRPLDNAHKVTTRDGVAIVPVIGPIARYADLFTEISGATSIETLARDFRAALDDRSVRAIVLEVDSPGGTVAGVSEFANQVREARDVKPVVAYVGSQAASAGYWIASAASRVVADSTATLGSIGVVMGLPRKRPTDPIEIVSSQSPYKRVDPATEAGKAHIQATADDLADLFVDAVAANRGVSRDAVLSDFGQGGSFVASRAVAAGMADAVGSLEQVIASLSRGEMPAPSKKTKPAAEAGPTPKEPAMSEQATPPVAGDTATISAADLAELRRMAGGYAQSEAARKAAVEEAISARADAFVRDFAGAADRTTFAMNLRAAFVQAAGDDLDHPVAGSRTHRQDALRDAMKARPAPTKEVVASDPAEETRALESDPAAAGAHAEEDAELAAIDAEARAWARSRSNRKN